MRWARPWPPGVWTTERLYSGVGPASATWAATPAAVAPSDSETDHAVEARRGPSSCIRSPGIRASGADTLIEATGASDPSKITAATVRIPAVRSE